MFGSDQVTTGAGLDLKQATQFATYMVRSLGMSEKLGLRTITESEEQLSAETKDNVDSEIRRILNESYERAKNILKTHPTEFKLLAETLLKYETLDASEIKYIIENNRVPKTLTCNNDIIDKKTKIVV